MMNEFYELKPGETIRNVRMYNSATVLLNNLLRKTNFACGESLECDILVSHYGKEDLLNALLTIRICLGEKVLKRSVVSIDRIKNGAVSTLYHICFILPEIEKPSEMKLSVMLDGGEVFAENEWELYLFPKAEPDKMKAGDLVISRGMQTEELTALLRDGKRVLLLGTQPFCQLPMTFRIALAGRTSGNLATVIQDHPVLRDMPQDGFCGWQFSDLLEGAAAVCFETDSVAFHPIIEVVSTHKFVIRQAAMFEFCVGKGKLFVCSLHFKKEDHAAQWLLEQILTYLSGDEFEPEDCIEEADLLKLADGKAVRTAANTNFAFNPNDKTAVRRKKAD